MNQNQDDGEKGDRRERRERRSQTLPFWNFRRLHGRRRVNRRAEQHNTLYFVERIPGHAFFMSVLLLICTIIDGLATIVLLDYGMSRRPISSPDQGQQATRRVFS